MTTEYAQLVAERADGRVTPAVVRELTALLGPGGVISELAQLRTYECDGLTGYRVTPALVLLPVTTAEVAAVVGVCAREDIAFVARGAGTGLSGGALPVADGVVIGLSRMRSVLAVDPVNQSAVVQPGVTNAAISAAVAEHDLYFAPDPSSQVVCTIGGNVAENSGGAHCLKYGFTTHHVRGLTLVTAGGQVVTLGGAGAEPVGPSLLSLVIGSEGTLGIVTEVTVRLLRRPEAVRTLVADFADVESAAQAVSDIVAAGIVPAAVEMLDALAIEACERATHAGYTVGAAAALVVELDGVSDEVAADFAAVERICHDNRTTGIRVAADDRERLLIWKGRKAAFAAMGRMSPDYFVQDGVIPRTRLATVLGEVASLADAAGLRVANVFHAGDGNLHPLVLYDAAVPGQAGAAERLATRIVELCVAEGGSITGEHGVGSDKACSMPKMFSDEDLTVMARVRDAFDPAHLCNPGKVLPTPRLCGERPGPWRPHPLEASGLIDRF
ncbi:MAG TPA: FAD-linked oxidase C-terminal domain-containing protein [Friedmanniella sp.]